MSQRALRQVLEPHPRIYRPPLGHSLFCSPDKRPLGLFLCPQLHRPKPRKIRPGLKSPGLETIWSLPHYLQHQRPGRLHHPGPPSLHQAASGTVIDTFPPIPRTARLHRPVRIKKNLSLQKTSLIYKLLSTIVCMHQKII